MYSFAFCGRAGTGNRMRCLGVGSSWQAAPLAAVFFGTWQWPMTGQKLALVCIVFVWLQPFGCSCLWVKEFRNNGWASGETACKDIFLVHWQPLVVGMGLGLVVLWPGRPTNTTMTQLTSEVSLYCYCRMSWLGSMPMTFGRCGWVPHHPLSKSGRRKAGGQMKTVMHQHMLCYLGRLEEVEEVAVPGNKLPSTRRQEEPTKFVQPTHGLGLAGPWRDGGQCAGLPVSPCFLRQEYRSA